MAKRHWYTGLRGACKVPRTLLGWWYEIKPRDFLDRHTIDPDRYCSDCAKAARLALAKESAPKPDAVVWPKPRPISEAPTDEAFLGFVSSDKKQTVLAGWYRMTAASDVVTDAVTGWIILGAIPYRDQHFQITRLAVTHFLPLPPEVR